MDSCRWTLTGAPVSIIWRGDEAVVLSEREPRDSGLVGPFAAASPQLRGEVARIPRTIRIAAAPLSSAIFIAPSVRAE